MYNVHCTLYIIQHTIYGVYCETLQCTVHIIAYSQQCAMCNVQCTLQTVYGIVHSVYYMLKSIHFTVNSLFKTPLSRSIHLTKTTAAQNEVALSYRSMRGLCFLAVVFVRGMLLREGDTI